jgi:hypothetical protein
MNWHTGGCGAPPMPYTDSVERETPRAIPTVPWAPDPRRW